MHLTILGAYASSRSLLPILQQVIGSGRWFDLDAGAGANIFSFAGFAGTAGTVSSGVTGTVPTGMKCQRNTGSGSTTAVASIESGAEDGNKLVMTFTPGGATQETFLIQPSANSGYIATSLAQGTWVRGRCYVEVNSYAYLREVSFAVKDQPSNFISTGNLPTTKTSDIGNYPASASGYWIETAPFPVGASNTGLNPKMQITIQGNKAGTPVVKTSRWVVQTCADPRPLYNF